MNSTRNREYLPLVLPEQRRQPHVTWWTVQDGCVIPHLSQATAEDYGQTQNGAAIEMRVIAETEEGVIDYLVMRYTVTSEYRNKGNSNVGTN